MRKLTTGFSAMVILSICFSCQIKSKPVSSNLETIIDSIGNLALGQMDSSDVKSTLERQDTTDKYCFFYLKMLNQAYNLAVLNKSSFSFQYEAYCYRPDSMFGYSTSIKSETLFEEKRKHVMIKMKDNSEFFYYFLLQQNDSLKYIFRYESDHILSSDTLMDINGDGYRDLVMYPRSMGGCCAASVADCFIYLPTTGKFSNLISFMNPTFYPKEGKVIGYEYGHKGERGLYKMIWKGLKVDTVEYIYRNANNPKRFIKTKEGNHSKVTEKDGLILKKLPDEYLHWEGLKAF